MDGPRFDNSRGPMKFGDLVTRDEYSSELNALLDKHYQPRTPKQQSKPRAFRGTWRGNEIVGQTVRGDPSRCRLAGSNDTYFVKDAISDLFWLDDEPKPTVTDADRQLAEEILRLAYGVVTETNKIEASKLIAQYRTQGD